MIKQRHRLVPLRKLRKPSAKQVKTGALRRWWKFGFSEGQLTKVKLSFSILIAIVALVSTLLTLLKIYASDEETFKRYADRVVAWHYKTHMWNGYFSSSFEGMVNIAELNLSDSTMQLALQTSGNTIDGGMSEKKLCGIYPPQDFKLVRGAIAHFGNSADIQIFDIVQGYTKIYAEFTLRHDDLVLEVTPKRNSRWFGGETARLVQHPESTMDVGFKKMEGVCKDENAQHREVGKRIYDKLVRKGAVDRR
ncbi:MAG: hypothetical protein Q8L87_14655 [Anaerolineales bacterium]|nr:hypothetical protein [Anaerolineales bacterium]